MKNVKLLLILFISFLFTGAAIAQGTVKGIVKDAGSHETLVGASIVVVGTQSGVTTSLDGSFSLKVPAGKHTLKISFVGYQPTEVNVSLDQGQIKDLGVINLTSSTVGLQEVNVMASIAVDRKTPVAISTVQPQVIAQQLGNQEFPEILKYTPSVYATKEGGGYGDSRINLRGFSSNNIGVLINGIPVNDMENGHVYWSDWAGLSDVTQTIQVQRGLGASKMALSSVGGTINIITKSTDAERGGIIYSGMGNDGMHKYMFTLSTGLMKNGWAITVSGAHTFGNGYIDGTNFDGYSYFLNVAKQFTPNHRISFTLFGAPQWHNQRGNQHFISTYLGQRPTNEIPYPITDKYRYNSDYGYRNGKVYGGAYGYNYYDKPQASLNDYWKISENSFLSTAVYASIAKGGGRRVDGTGAKMLQWNYSVDEPYSTTKLTPYGTYDFDAVAAINMASLNGSQAIIGESINSHQWYGVLSTLNTKAGYMNYTLGLDARYYIGEHAKQIEDLLGGTYYLDSYGSTSGDINRPENTPLHTGDFYAYHDDGIIRWLGLFAQGEYVKDNFSAFLSGAVSSKGYNRRDYFLYTPGNQYSGWVNFMPWSVKTGANYNFSKHHNLYINGGYFTRAPYFNIVYPNYTNDINHGAKYERVVSGEIGYGYTSRMLNVKLGYYYTSWMDEGLRVSFGQVSSNISGLNELHQGVELTAVFKPVSKFVLNGMLSVGSWKYTNNVHFTAVDQNNNVLGTYSAYIKGLHVGNAAQTTAGLRASMEVVQGMNIGVGYTYFGNNYADFNPQNRTKADVTADAWKMPDFGLIDLDINYDFKLGPFNATIYGNVQNLFNTIYIADATDGLNHSASTALVWYGFGRTWYTGLKIRF
ncbi:MAG: TonB-dependent receptor [Bacteroidales bacterium]|nr:TonB-dependent receptor [Bacteroidales bacterium]